MTDDLAFTSALDLKARIASKEISPVEIAENAIRRLHDVEPRINAFVTLTEDMALDAARRAEKAVLDGGDPGLLGGLPVSVKDLIAMEGTRLTSGSHSAAGKICDVDAPSVERLKNHGACIVGKTTTSEFGCKAVGDCPLTGITRNPWNTDKTTGGSSAGAGASVAAGVTPLALGTDGGGSVRIPAALTGLFTIKPQFGRIPVYPASSTAMLSHVGPMTRTVRDGALLLQAIAGFDRRDPYSVSEQAPDFLAACDRPIKGLRVAWSPDYGYARPDAEVVSLCEAAAKVFEEMGCEVETVDDPLGGDPVEIWDAEFYTCIGMAQRDVLRSDPGSLDPAVAETLLKAIKISADDYFTLVARRNAFRDRMRQFFERYDLLLSPTLPVPAFNAGDNLPPGHEDANIVSWVRYTYPFNLTGHPAASVPAGFTSDGLPVGLQIVSGALREPDILAASAAFEKARPWADKRPPV